ncbi:twin transmembrane helix small protein [Gammaproteobacteria bacterium AB-CW1]|uniref:Twin transmembrane helix small protein n=1 Tax=Natronospira elongata TaxID=3110268 RepID=A0AAP6JFL4_9GAMM|nr:twin transmembrane helix small protein [Gammaproteobacteria bacterium AB-CW1]
MRLLILIIIVAILISLGSALRYLLKDAGQSKRAVWALTIRVGLSVALFLLLMLGFALGIIEPTGPPVK